MYQEIGKFLSREFQDNIDSFEQIVEPRLGVGRERAALSMAILTQLTMAAIAMIVGFTVFRDRGWDIYAVLEATSHLDPDHHHFQPAAAVCFLLAHQRAAGWTHFALPLRLLIYLILPITLVLGFCQSVAALTREHGDADSRNARRSRGRA